MAFRFAHNNFNVLNLERSLAFYEKALPEPLRRADHCTGCGRCEPHCPQMIKVSEEIAAVDAWIDELKTEAAK